MTSGYDYRLKLATGFLEEARQDITLGRWRSVMDNAQLAVENAAKAVLALIGPVGRSHQPGPLLREAITQERFPKPHLEQLMRLAERAELLGPDLYIQTDYGDEAGGLTPWELFDEGDAQQALAMAEEAVSLTENIGEHWSTSPGQQTDEEE
jgi:HEPN domain-containing protein